MKKKLAALGMSLVMAIALVPAVGSAAYASSMSICIGGQDYYPGDTLPSGISLDASTSTVTFNNYQGTFTNLTTDCFYSGDDITINLVGTNTINCKGMQYRSAINCYGNLTIEGTGTLNLNFSNGCCACQGIQSKGVMSIDGCTVNIKSVNPKDGYFYGITQYPWRNYYEGADYAAIEISNANVSINSKVPADSRAGNAGIDAQDSDLSIENSNVAITLENGTVFGLCAGLIGNSDSHYGGKLTIDSASTITVDATKGDPYYTTTAYFFDGDLSNTHIYAGDSFMAAKKITTADFSKYYGRLDCYEDYLEFSPHVWTTNIKSKGTLTSDGFVSKSCSHCSESSSMTIPKIKSIKPKATTREYDGEEWYYTPIALDRLGNEVSTNEKEYGSYKNVGTFRIVVTSDSDFYSFTKTITYKIVPKKAVVSKLTRGKRKLTVKMSTKAAATGGSYYQIAYKQKGTSKWKYTTCSKQTKAIKKLKKGKKYYVKVRAFKTVSKVKYYGSWSAVKLSGAVK